mgnify:CR=1 FL=1
MKLAYFDDFKLGIVKGDGLVDVSNIVDDIPHTNSGNLMIGLIAVSYTHLRAHET